MYNLYQGDCLELMKTITDCSIDMVLCDLPYGTTHCSWDSLIDLSRLWKEYRRIVKPNGAILLFSQSPFDKVLAVSNLEEFRYEWIWEKNRATGHYNAGKMPLKAHENILVFYRTLPNYYPQKTTGHAPINHYTKKKDVQSSTPLYQYATKEYSGGGETDRFPRDVLYFPTERGLHPTQKPVDLCEYLIKTYTKEGDVVLDNCMGSGTTGVAALRTGRRFIGMEIEEKYFVVSKNRIEQELQSGFQEKLLW